MFAREAAEGDQSAVVLDQLADDEAEEDAEPDLGVVLGVHGPGEVSAHAGPEVGAAERGRVRRGHEEVAHGRAAGGVRERGRGAEGVEVDGPEPPRRHQRVRVRADGLDHEPEPGSVLGGEPERPLAPVVDRDRDAGLASHAKAAEAGRAHRVEVIERASVGREGAEEEDRRVAVDRHPRVVEDRGRPGRERSRRVRGRDHDRGAALRDRDEVHRYIAQALYL